MLCSPSYETWWAGSSQSRSLLLVHSAAATTTAASGLPIHFLVPISHSEMHPTGTFSSPLQSPTLRKNVQTTSWLATRSSMAMAPSISKSGKPLHPMEHALSPVAIYISNNASFRLKHPGVPDSSDGSDGTLYPLTENNTLPVAQATSCVAYLPPLPCTWYTHHQNDTCVTLFAGAAVML